MSAQINVNPLPDVETVQQTQQITIQMLKNMDFALMKIANFPNAKENGIYLKSIAVTARLECQELANSLEDTDD